MPAVRGYNYLLVARSDLSKWPEARALRAATMKNVAKFISEDLLCRHGTFERLVVDGGPENKSLIDELTDRFSIKKIKVSAYNPQANGMIERGHKPIVDGLAKMQYEGLGDWVSNLHTILWADRTSVNNTGYTPFYLEYGNEAVLPVDLALPTWLVHDWRSIRSRADLLAMRGQQLLRRDEDIEEATHYLRRMREMGKEIFDNSHQLRNVPLEKGDIVLVHDTKLDMSHSNKLDMRWRGPYKIREAIENRGSYHLEEMDGTPLIRTTFAGNRLKKFVCADPGFGVPLPQVPHPTDGPAASILEGSEAGEASDPLPSENPRIRTRQWATNRARELAESGPRVVDVTDDVEQAETDELLERERQFLEHIPDEAVPRQTIRVVIPNRRGMG